MSKFNKIEPVGNDKIIELALKKNNKKLPTKLEIPEYAKQSKPIPVTMEDSKKIPLWYKVSTFFSGLWGGVKDVYVTAKKGLNAIADIKQILIWLAIVTGSIIAITILVKIL